MQTDHKNNKYGQEKLAIWLDEEFNGRVTSGISDDFRVDFKKSLTLQKWANIRISQQLMYGKYLYEVELNGKEVISIENLNPKDLLDLKVYTSSPLYEAVPASIRNLIVTNGHDGRLEKKSYIVRIYYYYFLLIYALRQKFFNQTFIKF